MQYETEENIGGADEEGNSEQSIVVGAFAKVKVVFPGAFQKESKRWKPKDKSQATADNNLVQSLVSTICPVCRRIFKTIKLKYRH